MYTDEMASTGNHLFRLRSYIPIVFLLVLLVGMREFSYIRDNHALDLAWDGVCVFISMFGLAIRIHVVGHTPARTSGRNTKGQVAEALNTTGLYSLVRHPLYVGNFFMWLGVAMLLHDWRIVLLTVTLYWLYYERIMIAEEAFISNKFGDAFRTWADRTPAFVPSLTGLGRYQRPPLPFSLRNALKREHSGFFAAIGIMFGLEIVGDAVVYRELVIDPIWLVAFSVSAAIYLTLRSLKLRTNLLDVQGR